MQKFCLSLFYEKFEAKKPSAEEFILMPRSAKKTDFFVEKSGISSVGRALASQAEGRESESRIPLIQQAPPIKGRRLIIYHRFYQ
jgi:hypothetical protein